MLSPFSNNHEADAPWSRADQARFTELPEGSWLRGLTSQLREKGYGENSWLTSIILAMLVLLALNFNSCRRLFKSFSQDLVGVRRRQNAFDEHTANESRLLALIMLLMCLSEGILMFSAADYYGLAPDSSRVFGITMAMSAIALLFYLGQLLAYRVVGFAFADRVEARQWLRGFNASQVLLSSLLLFPSLIALFYPSATGVMLVVAATAYVATRLIFIVKGFRIFYDNFPALLYFILYLCASEITPLFVVRKTALDVLAILN